MKRIPILIFETVFMLTFIILGCKNSSETLPLVYSVENTGADCTLPNLPAFADLKEIETLPDPFAWTDTTKGRITSKSDWRCRRAEIGSEIQNYEIGVKPGAPDILQTSFADTILTITIVEGNDTLIMSSKVTIPSGKGPFPIVIGIGFWGNTGSLPSDLFSNRGIAAIQFNFSDIAPWGFDIKHGVGAFYKLYPDSTVGEFAAWAWGISRIIDAIEKTPELNVDVTKLAVTGCSFAGKIALFSGAFDERIALTIAQEPGGGGDAAWRVSETLPGKREVLRNAQGAPWYHKNLKMFNHAVTKLPYDHHELMAMVAPRALLVLGNPDYEWMAEESGHVACKAAKEVWKALGIQDRFGFSKVAGHQHCQLPDSQRPEVGAFIDKFLLGINNVNTNIETTPYNTDLSRWIKWTTPTLQ